MADADALALATGHALALVPTCVPALCPVRRCKSTRPDIWLEGLENMASFTHAPSQAKPEQHTTHKHLWQLNTRPNHDIFLVLSTGIQVPHVMGASMQQRRAPMMVLRQDSMPSAAMTALTRATLSASGISRGRRSMAA